jgi:hypothetical protein
MCYIKVTIAHCTGSWVGAALHMKGCRAQGPFGGPRAPRKGAGHQGRRVGGFTFPGVALACRGPSPLLGFAKLGLHSDRREPGPKTGDPMTGQCPPPPLPPPPCLPRSGPRHLALPETGPKPCRLGDSQAPPRRHAVATAPGGIRPCPRSREGSCWPMAQPLWGLNGLPEGGRQPCAAVIVGT